MQRKMFPLGEGGRGAPLRRDGEKKKDPRDRGIEGLREGLEPKHERYRLDLKMGILLWD